LVKLTCLALVLLCVSTGAGAAEPVTANDLGRFLPAAVGAFAATRDPGLRNLPVPGFYRAEAQQYYNLGSAIVTLTLYDPADRRFEVERNNAQAGAEAKGSRKLASRLTEVAGFGAIEVEKANGRFAYLLIDLGGEILVKIESIGDPHVSTLRQTAESMDLAGLSGLLRR
jgi:hypothetical protein